MKELTMNNCGNEQLGWSKVEVHERSCPLCLMSICFLLLSFYSLSSPQFFNEGSYGLVKLEGLPSGQISLSEGLPWGKGPLESWLEVNGKEGKESEGREEMGRPEVVGPEVGRELTWLETS